MDGTVDNAQNQAESSMNGGFGFGNMNMGFLNMNNFGGGLEQMQMMMAMQNGMPPNAFANFPMMGESPNPPLSIVSQHP